MITRPATSLGDFALTKSEGRSPGVHLSDLYNDFYQLIDPKRYDKSKPMDVLRLEAGLQLERIIEDGLKAKLGEMIGGERPGELTTEGGLPFSPDLIRFDDRGTVLGEMKVTWMSCKECPISPAMAKRWGLKSNWDGVDPDFAWPSKFDKYFTQMKCYCYHLRIRHATLIVYFVNADYAPPRPVFLYWDFEWSQREIDEEWQKIRNHGSTRRLWHGDDVARDGAVRAGRTRRRSHR